jgi:hypothetical protein
MSAMPVATSVIVIDDLNLPPNLRLPDVPLKVKVYDPLAWPALTLNVVELVVPADIIYRNFVQVNVFDPYGRSDATAIASEVES